MWFMMIYARNKRFCLTFLRKMAQIIGGGVMSLCSLNIKKGKLNMNKTEFVEAVAKEAKASKAAANEMVNAVVAVVTKALKKGESVQITGFGTFEVANRAARKGRNPATGKEMKIAASKAPKFKAGKVLKDAVK
jgi:DNA-binding protein HU-beta